MSTTHTPEDPQIPQSTIIVPARIWTQIRRAAESPTAAPEPLLRELDRLDNQEAVLRDPEEGSLAYQILDVLAKSDGNLSTHLSRHTLTVMYGEMVRNLTETFTITRKDQADG